MNIVSFEYDALLSVAAKRADFFIFEMYYFARYNVHIVRGEQ